MFKFVCDCLLIHLKLSETLCFEEMEFVTESDIIITILESSQFIIHLNYLKIIQNEGNNIVDQTLITNV